MKTLKLLFLAFAISVSTVTYAEKTERIYDLSALSGQIELLLRDYRYSMTQEQEITLFFSVSEDRTIQFLNIASTDKRIGELLEKKLQHQKLDGEKWIEGKIYELSIHGKKPSKICLAHQ